MISHKHKIIFIHIPKCAGSSIKNFLFDYPKLDWREPNYDLLYGWCPERKIHLQHATSNQLLDLGLISKKTWKEYFKFAFIRNPYDRAYSDYLWIQKDRNIKGKFKDYITLSGDFKKILSDNSVKEYRGDHLIQQTEFFDFNGFKKMDFIGRFENIHNDMNHLKEMLHINKRFDSHAKKSINKKTHYSYFYTNQRKQLVDKYFKSDVNFLDYTFTDKKRGIYKLKKWF